MQFAIFGRVTCVEPKKNECSNCKVKAAGLQVTFLLYKSPYSIINAEEWEQKVFERNVISFNKALQSGYHEELPHGVIEAGMGYNEELIA